MGKFFGLAMMVVALWAGLTVYTDGVDGLTGQVDSFLEESTGKSSSRADSSPAEVRRSLPRRVGDVVEAKLRKRDEERSRRLDNL